jgi:hypothetical protein
MMVVSDLLERKRRGSAMTTMFVEGVAAGPSGAAVALGKLFGVGTTAPHGDLALVALVDGCGKSFGELESALNQVGNPELDDEAFTISVEPAWILWREGEW